MIVTKINTHALDAINRLLEQYKGRPRIEGMITAEADQIQSLEDAIFALDEGRQVWNGEESPAVGAQLDVIGQIVGIARNGLADAEYLLFIFGKIAQNFSDTTVPTLLNIIGFVFQAEKVKLQQIYPAGVAIQVIGTPIPKALYPVAVSLVQAAFGAGINLVFTGAAATTKVFRFQAPDTTSDNGFGSVDDLAVGGGFIGLI